MKVLGTVKTCLWRGKKRVCRWAIILLRGTPVPSTWIGSVKGAVGISSFSDGLTILEPAGESKNEIESRILQSHPNFRKCRSIERSADFVLEIPGGRVWWHGNVITPGDRLLEDVSRILRTDYLSHEAFWQMRFPKVEKVSGTVATISSVACENYYHWLYESLPRFGLLDRAGVSPKNSLSLVALLFMSGLWSYWVFQKKSAL